MYSDGSALRKKEEAGITERGTENESMQNMELKSTLNKKAQTLQEDSIDCHLFIHNVVLDLFWGKYGSKYLLHDAIW